MSRLTLARTKTGVVAAAAANFRHEKNLPRRGRHHRIQIRNQIKSRAIREFAVLCISRFNL